MKPPFSVASSPELTSWTLTSSGVLIGGLGPKLKAGGVRMTTWLKEMETTVHSTAGDVPPVPRKTWSGAENPEPMIETLVFPSFEPDEGMTAVTLGVPVPTVPNAKQLGTESVMFPRNVRVIDTGVELDVASGKAGVMTVTEDAVTAVTGASRVMPRAVNCARVVVASPGNLPPLIVKVVPPVFGPDEGLQLEKNGSG